MSPQNSKAEDETPMLRGFTPNRGWKGGKSPGAPLTITSYRDRQHPYGGPTGPLPSSSSQRTRHDPGEGSSTLGGPPEVQPPQVQTPAGTVLPTKSETPANKEEEPQLTPPGSTTSPDVAVEVAPSISNDTIPPAHQELTSPAYQHANTPKQRDIDGDDIINILDGDAPRSGTDGDGDSAMVHEDQLESGNTTPKHKPASQPAGTRTLPQPPQGQHAINPGSQPWTQPGSYTYRYGDPDPVPSSHPTGFPAQSQHPPSSHVPSPGHYGAHPPASQLDADGNTYPGHTGVYFNQNTPYPGQPYPSQHQYNPYPGQPNHYTGQPNPYAGQPTVTGYAGHSHGYSGQYPIGYQHQYSSNMNAYPDHGPSYSNGGRHLGGPGYQSDLRPSPAEQSPVPQVQKLSDSLSDSGSVASRTSSRSTRSTVIRKRRRQDVGDRQTHAPEPPPPELSNAAELQAQAQAMHLTVLENLKQLEQFVRSGPFAAQGDVTRLTQVQERLLESSVTTNNLLRQLVNNPIQPVILPSSSNSSPAGGSTEGSPRKKAKLTPTHRSSGALALGELFRQFFRDNVKSQPADQAKFAAWKPTDGPPCDSSHLFLDLTSTPCSPWNKAVREMLIDSFLQTDSPLLASLKPTRVELCNLYRSSFRTAQKKFNREKNPNPLIEETQRRDHRRAVRKLTLFWHRVEVIEQYTELHAFRDVMAYLHAEGMSTDESDHDTATGVPTYVVRSKHWLSRSIIALFRVCDALWRFHRMTKKIPRQDRARLREAAAFPYRQGEVPRKKADRGARPHLRLRGDNISPRYPICGLPSDFYDEEWLKKQTPAALYVLQPQPISGIKFDIHPDLLALTLNNHGNLNTLHIFT